jgi:hypothetical protein
MQYTLTKYLTADYLRENDFLRAYLELVDEIIFCCSMESLDVLSTMSFENMDDNYFLAYMNFFLNGLSTYDVNKLDKLILSEWFSLLHVRGELSDIDKLLKFGGSLKNKEKNVFELYHSADVPNQTIDTTKDGLIYLITENNIDLDQDYLINQQIPAGYRIGLIKTPSPTLVRNGDVVRLGKKNIDFSVNVDSGDSINLHKDFVGSITFYRRRQFDQYYTFGDVYRSQYTINQLSDYHRKGYYFFGFELDHFVPLPTEYNVENSVYGCLDSTYSEFFITEGDITSEEVPDQNNSFYVLDAVTGDVLLSTKGVVDHLVCDKYNILEDGGVQHIDAPINSIEIFLGLSSSNGSFAAHTFSANDYWGSCVLDQSDKSILEDFGISLIEVSSGLNISSSNTSNFTFEVLGLYSGMRTGELVADLSNFSAEPKGGWNDRVCICSVNAYSQKVMTWKCRITKN